MPKVATKKKNNAGQPYSCERCSSKIVAGEQYYEWSFRYGGTHRQHVAHGSPKQSQLTPKMSGAYAAVEAAEDAIASAESVNDLKAALEECASEIDNVAQEYQDSFDAIPENLQQGCPAQEMQEKSEALQSFSEELTGNDLENFDKEEPVEPVEPVREGEDGPLDTPEYREWESAHKDWETAHGEWQTLHEEHLEEQRSAAEEIIGNLSV
jgi:hypothetical protein